MVQQDERFEHEALDEAGELERRAVEPFGDEDFEDALARALHGEVLTDVGASAAMIEALLRVAAARTAADRRTAVRSTRALRERERPSEYVDPDFAP